MQDLNKKAFAGLARLFITLAALLFLPAWTLRYWQAWIFLVAFFIPVLVITAYIMRNDPKLLERRVSAGPGAEKEKSQKTIQTLASIAFVAVILFPAIDHRLGWSTVPVWGGVSGDALVALGLLGIFFVFKENTYTSATIEVAAEQKVVDTGPYALVRHPMYTSALVMLLGVPLALGSWWGLLTVIPITLVMVWRLLEEERFLAKNLSGYMAYMTKVRWRLLPSIW